jgi:polyhydroxyalkanoate synthesis regulator phasin
MARDGWFDGKGLDLVNSTREALQEQWDILMQDGVVSPDERVRLRQEIYKSLKKLEPRLGNEIHKDLTAILVKYEMLIELHDYKPGG